MRHSRDRNLCYSDTIKRMKKEREPNGSLFFVLTSHAEMRGIFIEMTDEQAKAFYNSAAWKHKRIDILKRDHYECQDCLHRARTDIDTRGYVHIRRASEVHHIIEYKERPDLGLNDDNLISLCTVCHNIRHGRVPRQFHNEKKKRVTEEMW